MSIPLTQAVEGVRYCILVSAAAGMETIPVEEIVAQTGVTGPTLETALRTLEDGGDITCIRKPDGAVIRVAKRWRGIPLGPSA